MWVNDNSFESLTIRINLEIEPMWRKNYFGLEKIGGIREVEDLRKPFIISLRVQKMSGEEPINKR